MRDEILCARPDRVSTNLDELHFINHPEWRGARR
jgi:hypothetical protein